MKKGRVRKPWGCFETLSLNECSTVKILNVKPGARTSLQFHLHRREFWKILEGNARITIGRRIFRARAGDEFLIPARTLHRVGALSKTARILEISFGKFDENDIARVEDDYGRAQENLKARQFFKIKSKGGANGY